MTNTSVSDVRPPTDARRPDGLSGDELRGRAAGVFVAAVMGLAWAASGSGVLSVAVAVPVVLACIVIAGALMAGAHRLRRAATPTGPSAPRADAEKLRRRFAAVTAGECAAILASTSLLVRAGESQWIPAVVCAAVGVHFVPLARMFGVRLYYATAAALCLTATTTMILGAAGAPWPLWRLLPAYGAAFVLWATSARLLLTSRRVGTT